jgi:hypothetical protein
VQQINQPPVTYGINSSSYNTTPVSYAQPYSQTTPTYGQQPMHTYGEQFVQPAQPQQPSVVVNAVQAPPQRKKVMLILFGVAFVIVAVGLITALVGLSQFDNCAVGYSGTIVGELNIEVFSGGSNYCLNEYNTMVAGWVVFGLGIVICCIDCCVAVGYSLAH